MSLPASRTWFVTGPKHFGSRKGQVGSELLNFVVKCQVRGEICDGHFGEAAPSSYGSNGEKKRQRAARSLGSKEPKLSHPKF